MRGCVLLCVCLFVCYLFLFVYILGGLVCFRICAGTPYSAPRETRSCDCKNLDIVRNFAKSCQLTILLVFAYGVVLIYVPLFYG